MSGNMGEMLKDIIDKIKSDVGKNGECNLSLIDQMTLANAGIDILTLCTEEGWIPEHGGADTSVRILKLPDGYQYEENPGPGMLPEIVQITL